MGLSRSFLQKKLHHLYVGLLARFTRPFRPDGVGVMEEEWDNLVVLDACRYDDFKDLNDIPGTLRKVNSKGTSTAQWLQRNFPDYYDDVVYVAGNPHVSDFIEAGAFRASEHFHHVEPVWDEGWDDEFSTVPPDAVNRAVRRLKEEYPGKRFIIHYMQPHEPFIGETNFQNMPKESFLDRKRIWQQPDIRQAYRDNLELVLDSVKELLPELDGKTTITSDHGEMFGERLGVWSHPDDVFLKELYRVPWLDING